MEEDQLRIGFHHVPKEIRLEVREMSLCSGATVLSLNDPFGGEEGVGDLSSRECKSSAVNDGLQAGVDDYSDSPTWRESQTRLTASRFIGS